MDATKSSAPAHPSTTTPEKPRRLCEACGEPSGSISAGTGFPLVRDRGSGSWFHVNCRPGSRSATAYPAVFLGVAL